MARTDNTVFIDAPLELVWQLTNDVESWPVLFTEYARAEVLSRDENSLRFRLTTHPDADGKTWSWVSERTSDRSSLSVRSRRIETGPFEHMDIEWTYALSKGGIQLRWQQDFTVRPGLGFDDEAMTTRLNDTTAVQQAVIKARIEGIATGLSQAGDGGPQWHRGLPAGRARNHADALMLLTCGARLAAIVASLGELGIADLLASGARSPAELARLTDTHAQSLQRVLRAAATAGVFTEQPDGAFALTPLSRSLLRDNPYSLWPLVDYSRSELVRVPYEHLTHSIRTGEPSFESALGLPFWKHLENDPELSEFFDTTMTRLGQWETEKHLDLIAPERFSRIADLGGGAGHFLAAALRRAPEVTGVLLERPDVLDGAHAQLADAGVLDRVQLYSGDLFGPNPVLPAQCDAYVLKAVLHNWPDQDGRRLLTALRRHIGTRGSRLFIVEQVVAGGNVFDHAKFLDVDMLALFGGVERDVSTWRSLLADCGFRLSAEPEAGRWTVLQCEPA